MRNVLTTITVPTGHILIVQGERGPLECLSIGDYGKAKNIKADFMDLHREIDGVPHGDMMPLEKKWVITISSQYGCPMKCRFCDVPKVDYQGNATARDMALQVEAAMSMHPEVRSTKRLNLHFARMGEPTLNHAVIDVAASLRVAFARAGWGFHPVVSTLMPERHNWLRRFLDEWVDFKNNDAGGDAGLQLSINTTDQYRREMDFGGCALPLTTIADMAERWQVVGRKITLNFALTDAPIDAALLAKLFDPARFLCKITPMHASNAATEAGMVDAAAYGNYTPYRDVEARLKAAGFDVIVFVPSREEDTSRITCGNAILAESKAER